MIDYANPPMELILKAVPLLQWRECWECGHVGLYRDNMIPACNCHVCSSSDTRNLIAANKLLHRVETKGTVETEQ